MATSVNDDDDEKKKRSTKKGRDIKPLHEKELKQKLAIDKEMTQANAEVLEELARKTAELAEKVQGEEGPHNRTLDINNDPTDIFESLDTEAQKTNKSSEGEPNPAADLIRQKLDRLYGNEPEVAQEAAESIAVGKARSKHQEFMYKLTTSGQSLAEIQTQWHNYYVALPDDEKHKVWQEFYENQSAVSKYAAHATKEQTNRQTLEPKQPETQKVNKKNESVTDIKSQIISKLNAEGRLKTSDHVKSLLFGLGLAAFVGIIVAAVFFNQVFVAPFISPSSTVSATPIIGNTTADIGPEPKIIIPKINLEVPVVYDVGSIEEAAVQDALEDGVVHYAASPEPGEQGNVVIVGHSSNNILNSGRYKFAFVLLNRLENEDTFYLHKDGIRYTYKVYKKFITEPTDVAVLGQADKANTVTLITCDPPGTSLRRLIVVAEQISPDPSGNVASSVDPLDFQTEELPSNAPSLWSRFWPF